MVQPALKQDGVPEEGLRLMEQLNETAPLGGRLGAVRPEQSASSLARRFAPDLMHHRVDIGDRTRASQVAPATSRSFGRRSAGNRSGADGLAGDRRRFTVSVAAGLVSATALVGGTMWLAGIGDLDLDRVFQDAGLVAQTAPAPAAAALSINVLPPRASADMSGESGDGKVRAAARPEVAPPLSSGFAVRAGETDRIEGLMAHGQKMIDVGYFAGARAYYRRAAEAGSGEAALAVGATYDPDVVARMGAQGIKPDRAEAAKWYARAAGLGIGDRDTILRRLTKDWGNAPAASEEPGIMAAATPAPEISGPLKKPQADSRSTPAAPQQQRLASSRASAVNTARAQLLAPGAKPKTEDEEGPLSRFVRAAAGLSAQEEWMEVASPVNIRKGPSSTAGTDKVAQKGTKFRVVGRERNWIRVADPKNGKEGYIYSRFLKESSAP